MSNSDIDKALNFIQNAPAAANPAPAADKQPAAPQASGGNDACLPGLEPPPQKTPAWASGKEAASQPSPRPNASNPLAQALARQEKKGNLKTIGSSASAKDNKKSLLKPDFIKYAGWAVVAACAGVAIVAAVKFINPRVVVKEVVRELPDGIPLALLPESADTSLWSVVSKMAGTIDGVGLEFKHGIAYANGVEYKVCLDFCRSGDDIYVRVKGTSTWVVKLNEQGEIVKAYPSPKSNKPLKEIFGR